MVEETYTELRDRGYRVTLDGMSFLVSLCNRQVSKQEIDFILGNADINAKLTRTDTGKLRISL